MTRLADSAVLRLSALESRCRRLEGLSLLLGLALTAACAASALRPDGVAERVRARAFVVVDEAGNEFGTLGLSNGQPTLALQDASGEARAIFGVGTLLVREGPTIVHMMASSHGDDGSWVETPEAEARSSPAAFLHFEQSTPGASEARTAASLLVSDDGFHWAARHALTDRDDAATWAMLRGDDAAVGLELGFEGHGDSVAKLVGGPGAAGVSVAAGDRWAGYLRAGADGTHLEVSRWPEDEEDVPTVALDVGAGGPSITVSDEQGEERFRVP